MSADDRNLERDLTDELRRRAVDVTPASGLAGAARQRAQRIRHRRYLAAGAATALALAIAVPTAVSLVGAPHTAPLPAGTTTPTPSASSTPAPPGPDRTSPPADPPNPPDAEPSAGAGTTELRLDGLDRGSSPSIGWIEGTTYHRPDGNDVELPESIGDPLAYGSAVYARSSLDSDGVAALRPGDEPEISPGHGPIVSGDGGAVGWFDTQSNRLTVLTSPEDGTVPLESEVPADQQLHPVGFLGPRDVVSNVTVSDGLPAGVRRDRLTDDGTENADPQWDVEQVTAVSGAAQLIVGSISNGDVGPCSAVYEADGDTPLWETCEYSFDHFSPDGRYLVGSHAYRDGIGDAYAVVVDARTGAVVHTFTAVGGDAYRYVTGTAFEDDSHVLVVAHAQESGHDQAVLRCALTGGCELATDVATTGDDEDVYAFGAQP